uniref:Secreted protein n=1 Tax=Gouania willdenowi TaxID=441366 RepID=A0A8C5GLM7_GOUWI
RGGGVWNVLLIVYCLRLTTPVCFPQGSTFDEPCAGLDCSRGCKCHPEKGHRVSQQYCLISLPLTIYGHI